MSMPTTSRSTITSVPLWPDIKFIDQSDAVTLDKDLMGPNYKFGTDQMLELTGLAVAEVVYHVYPVEKFSRVIVCVGSGNNGSNGLVCARHLKMFGYKPRIVCPKRSSGHFYGKLHLQCAANRIMCFYEWDHRIMDSSCDLIIDSILGFAFFPPNWNPEFSKIVREMSQVSKTKGIPILSIDIPSGWHVEFGHARVVKIERDTDVEEELKMDLLEPECLVSILAPKECAQLFKGKYHYLAGRFVPRELDDKFHLNLPDFPGTQSFVALKDDTLRE